MPNTWQNYPWLGRSLRWLLAELSQHQTINIYVFIPETKAVLTLKWRNHFMQGTVVNAEAHGCSRHWETRAAEDSALHEAAPLRLREHEPLCLYSKRGQKECKEDMRGASKYHLLGTTRSWQAGTNTSVHAVTGSTEAMPSSQPAMQGEGAHGTLPLVLIYCQPTGSGIG